MENELWYLMISGKQNASTGIFGNFYAYGSHFGETLNKVINASIAYDFVDHDLVEVLLLDDFEDITDNVELIKIAENVYMRSTTYSFPLSDSDKSFVSPVGIVKSVFDGEYDYDLIKENFVAYKADENGVFELELVLGKEVLLDVFIKSLDFLPAIDGLCVYIKNFWDNELTELWTSKFFASKNRIVDFLARQKSSTVDNGYLDIVVYALEGETNLTLDDHKKLQFYTQDEIVFKNFIKGIVSLGYEQTRDFYSLEYGYHHFHYRLADSLTRVQFKQMLEENGFELIDSWEE